MLHTVEHGSDSDQPPMLIAHGLFGSGRNWSSMAKRLSNDRRVLVVDMRNHGLSGWNDSHRYDDLAADLAEVIESNGGCADLVGHSMGGKASMKLALDYPRMIRRLVVADIAPVAYTHDQNHLIDAMRSVELDGIRQRSDADAMLGGRVDDSGIRAFLLQSLDISKRRWRLNLEVLQAEMNAIVGWPQIDREADHPTLFLSGGDSDYVSQEGRAAARRNFPNARFAGIPGAGHWLHAEKPQEFEAAVRVFLSI